MRKSYITALVLAALATLWILSGTMGEPHDKDAAVSETPSAATGSPAALKVEVRRIEAATMADAVEINGTTEAVRRVELKAEVEGRIAEILAPEGARVAAGQPILRIDMRDRQARLSEARHTVTQKEIEFKAAEGLAEKGFSSKVRVEEARAGLEAARARLKSAEVELANTTIKAPFAGVLESRPSELGQYLTPGMAVGTIVDLDPVLVTGFVTEQQVGRIQSGTAATAALPDGGTREGKVRFVAATAEPQTRTFKVKIELPNDDSSIVEGLTAKVSIALPPQPAHQVEPSMLSLADDGRVGIKAVDEAGRVVFWPVSVLSSQRGETWVSGLPASVRAIVTGQEYVRAGDTVEAVDEVSSGPSTGEAGAVAAPDAVP